MRLTHAQRRATIVGAGPGGLTVAIALQRAGFDVTVFERNTELKPTGSGLTLWPNATRALDVLDLLPGLAEISRRLTHITMRDWRGRVIFGDSLARFDEGGRFAGVSVLRTDLIRLLARHVKGAIVTGAPLTAVRQLPDAVVATFADGREVVGDVLVGADGLHSTVRAQLVSSVSCDPLVPAGFTVWRGVAAMGFADATGTTWMGPGKQFGLFPLNQECAYWFAAQKTKPQRHQDRRPQRHRERRPQRHRDTETHRDRELVADAFNAWPDPIPQVVQATDDAAIVRTDIFDRDPLDRWSIGRVTLLGDAAHPAAPTLGQGACQAIEDAVALGAILAHTEDVVSALQRYEAHRMRRANGFVTEARRIGKLGLWEGALACWLRNRLMGAVPAALRARQLARMFAFALPPASEPAFSMPAGHQTLAKT